MASVMHDNGTATSVTMDAEACLGMNQSHGNGWPSFVNEYMSIICDSENGGSLSMNDYVCNISGGV